MNIKGLMSRLKGKIYVKIASYTFIFVVFAISLIIADHFSGKEIYELLPNFLLTQREMAVNIFIMEVSSLLAMLTLTFSIMMIVLTNYSSQLSPRTLQDFLEDKTTQNVMGYYIGVIVFSLISLYFVKYKSVETLLLSPFFGVLFFIGSILVFAYFIYYVSRSIRINLYIQDLSNETEQLIEKKQKSIDEDFRIELQNSEDAYDRDEENIIKIKTDKSGFIQFYDKEKLYDYAVKNNIIVYCETRIGQHILEDSEIFAISGELDKNLRENCKEDLGKMVSIGEEINLYEDLEAGTGKLTEIAIKALSPGINDPGTAIFCIEKIGYLLQKLAKISDTKIYKDKDKNVRVVVKGITFENLLFRYFYQIEHYGINDLFVLDALFKALITIAKDNKYFIKNEVYNFASYLLAEALDGKKLPKLEERFIKERFYRLAKETDKEIAYDEI